MAILPSIDNLEVTIIVGDQGAKEYDAPDDENPVDSMTPDDFDLALSQGRTIPYNLEYIEAKPGVGYIFQVTLGRSFIPRCHHIAWSAESDGNMIKLTHFDDTHRQQDGSMRRQVGGILDGNPREGYKILNYCFEPVTVVEEDNLNPSELREQVDKAKHCGTLKVYLYRMNRGDKYSRDGTEHNNSHIKPPKELPEKALKGRSIGCVAGTTPGLKRDAGFSYASNYADIRRRPFAIFEFRYRSKKGLVAEGIIPRPTVLDEVEEMSDGEVRRRLAELLERDQKNVPNPGVKREAPPMDDSEFSARYKTRKLSNGRLEIDLTDD
ncbi:hypothetical protein QBC44DRAFT_403233 [Cladorrhinum sp. PSN332]|nr:hypothetical protein QBC44DRAFT_403233 [Cladorrhinum sp. PSN332]